MKTTARREPVRGQQLGWRLRQRCGRFVSWLLYLRLLAWLNWSPWCSPTLSFAYLRWLFSSSAVKIFTATGITRTDRRDLTVTE